MPTDKAGLKPGDLVRWIGPMAERFIGKTAVVVSIRNRNPNTLQVAQTNEMAVNGLGSNWGSAVYQWEVVDKQNPRNEWGEEGL